MLVYNDLTNILLLVLSHWFKNYNGQIGDSFFWCGRRVMFPLKIIIELDSTIEIWNVLWNITACKYCVSKWAEHWYFKHFIYLIFIIWLQKYIITQLMTITVTIYFSLYVAKKHGCDTLHLFFIWGNQYVIISNTSSK